MSKARPVVDCSLDKIRTKQSFARETDINHIIRRIKKTGVIPDAMYQAGSYGDFTGLDDFQDAMFRIRKADESFMKLPATIRNRFDNEPGKLIEFMSDPNNLEEAQDLGLVPKDPEPEKMPPETPPAPPEAPSE